MKQKKSLFQYIGVICLLCLLAVGITGCKKDDGKDKPTGGNNVMQIEGYSTMSKGTIQTLSVTFTLADFTEDVTYTSSNETVIAIQKGNLAKALAPGKAVITATSKSGLIATLDITVSDITYKIEYNLKADEEALLPVNAPKEFVQGDLPLSLPKLSKDKYVFLGWKINDSSEDETQGKIILAITQDVNYDVILTPVWGVTRLEIRYHTSSIVEVSSIIKLNLEVFMTPIDVDSEAVTWTSSDETIATVDQEGNVTGLQEGYVEITAVLDEMPEINMTVGVTVMSGLSELDALLDYFVKESITEVIAKNINVTGYQFNYGKRLLGSVSNYLFQRHEVIEQMTALGSNRPGTVRDKYYVTVHDTASSAQTANGQQHANYVNNGGGGTSWHYTVGNDGVFHQIPDNEVAYHAGDGTRPYELESTGIPATTENPTITINELGFYVINGHDTNRRPYKGTGASEKVDDTVYKTEQINSVGIRVVIKDGYYYLGKTYFNDTYKLISNYGGNQSSIGIETCVNQGSDLYLTWQKTAKLVANLLVQNDLTLNDVKPHHFFSGKNCPQTMRDNGLWDNFLNLVAMEYEILTKYAGYEISFESHHPQLLDNTGRIIKQATYSTSVSYTITVTKDGVSRSVTLSTVVPGTILFRELI